MGRRLILGVGQRGKLAGRRIAESGYAIEAVGCGLASIERVVSDQGKLSFAIELFNCVACLMGHSFSPKSIRMPTIRRCTETNDSKTKNVPSQSTFAPSAIGIRKSFFESSIDSPQDRRCPFRPSESRQSVGSFWSSSAKRMLGEAPHINIFGKSSFVYEALEPPEETASRRTSVPESNW